jgi:predicted DNA-binding transcriptional regulator AlpA
MAGMDTTLLDVLDAASILNMSARQVRALARANKIPQVALPSGDLRFVESDLQKWIDSCKRPAAGEGGR